MSKSKFVAIDDQDESVVNLKDYSALKSFVFLYQYTKGHRTSFFAALIMLLFYALLAMASGYFIGKLVGDALVVKKWGLAIRYSAFVLMCEASSLLFHYYGRKILTLKSSKVILTIRKELFTKLAYLPMKFYDRWPQGRIVTRLTHDVESVEEFFVNSMGRMLNAFFLATASVITMLSTNFKLGLMIISAMLPALLLIFFTRHTVGRLSRAISKKSSAINSRLSEFVDGVFVIRSFGLESWSHNIFTSSVKEHVNASLEANKFHSWSRPVVSFLCGLPILLLIWFGGYSVLAKTMSLATFVAFIRYCEKFFSPVLMLFREIHVVIQAFTNAQRVANFLREEEELDCFKHSNISMKKTIKGEIEFKDVKMGYNKQQFALDGVSFKISIGEKIGIVGSTGSGKTTVISILSRLYDYQEGNVLIDGISLRDIDMYDLRNQIGLVSQDVIIFQGTLRENLSVDPDLSGEKILEIAQHTGLVKVMEKSGLSLDSEITDGGSNLSAGEKQVVSLTRTCLLDPHILILDEATANVDPYYESILHNAIEYLMQGRTSFIIAHRLDTISSCDRILVFQNGKLIEDGTPDALIASKGVFYDLKTSSEFIST